MKKFKIAVAMSGGVDSSLAASLLVEGGHEVTGVYLDCWGEPGCGIDSNRKDAMRVGLKLGIKMKVLDFKKEYKKKVMDWFFEEVKKGRTPNPDVLCNKEIKFGLFLDWGMKNGFDKIATGHFARHSPGKLCKEIKKSKGYSPLTAIDSGGRLFMAFDKHKDQTYFLAMVERSKFEKVCFPIGGMLKSEVRREAKKRGIHVWDKKSTSGICFIGHKISFEDLLKTRIKEHEGEVVDKKGRLIGKHKGHEFYTIGQRHGFEVRVKTNESKPLFVVSKNKDKNLLVVGEKGDLMRDEFMVQKFEVTNLEFLVRIRHGGDIRPLKSIKEIRSLNDIHHSEIDKRQKTFRVKLKEKVFGVAPGQVAVFYQKMEGCDPTVCLGGGVIEG
ncbi:MAG: tRNA 2-thiouridine(34) synthase MnmA [Candidatus Beckwithbacteria bacterium]